MTRISNFPKHPPFALRERSRRRPGSTRTRAGGVVLLPSLLLAGCSSFEPVSVYPRIVVQDASQEILIYGSGFQGELSGELKYLNSLGLEDSAPLTGFSLLADPTGETEHTAAATLPALSSEKVGHPVFPYQELVFYAGSATPGLYSCDTLEPVLWDPTLDITYCDARGAALSYARPESGKRPPDAEESARDYAAWYDLLGSCVASLSPESLVSEEQLRLLIPDYGSGCFFRDEPLPGETTFQYCPAYLAAVDVDLELTQGGQTVRLKNGLTLLDLSLDYYGYYGNDAYSAQVRGMLGDLGGTPIKAPGDTSAELAVGLTGDGSSLLAAAYEAGSRSVAVVEGLPFGGGEPVSTYVGGVSSLTIGDLTGTDGAAELVWAVPLDDGSDPAEGAIRYASLTAAGSRSMTALGEPIALAFDNMVVTHVSVADVSGDARPDLVAAGVYRDNPQSGRLAILYRASDGTMEATPVWMDLAGVPSGLQVAELDQSSGQDLVIVSGEAEKLLLLRNNGNRTFTVSTSPLNLSSTPVLAPAYGLNAQVQAIAPTLADVTGNGTTDVVLLETSENRTIAWVYEGNGAGGIASARSTPTDFLASAGALGDGDGDGNLDLFLIGAEGGSLMLRNSGTGTLTTTVETFAPLGAAALVIEDLDGDGDTDSLVLGLEDGVVSMMNNPSTLLEYFSYTLAGCAY